MRPPSPNPSPERGEGSEDQAHGGLLRIPKELRDRMTEVARRMRSEPTSGEARLWTALRRSQLDGRKFRRQHRVGPFVVDFYCPEERLAVEVDRPVHDSQVEHDRERQHLLESVGLRFVRVSAEQVENDLPSVLDTIRLAFLPSPLRGRGRGRGVLKHAQESP